MRKQFYAGVATIAIVAATPVFAQSSGSIAVEDIIVTAQTGDDGLSGIVVPDATKARGIITQELITTQAAGQTVLNTINLIPGVNFTNSDAYGSSGGNIRIRGFDGNRISLTFDGFPLNDSGNYAIYSNQQLDPELRDHRARDLVLHGEDVVERAVVGLRPQVHVPADIDQLRRDPHLPAGGAHAAFQYIAYL